MNAKMYLSCLAVLATFFAIGPAHAAKPWSFAGIQMAMPLESSGLADCPSEWAPRETLCIKPVEQPNDAGISVAHLGGLTALHWVDTDGGWVSLLNGRVTYIHIRIGNDVFFSVKRILTSRYGKPSSITHDDVTSNAGATVSSSKITWKESGNSIELTERCEFIDRSCVDVINDEMMREHFAAKKKAAAAQAGIL